MHPPSLTSLRSLRAKESAAFWNVEMRRRKSYSVKNLLLERDIVDLALELADFLRLVLDDLILLGKLRLEHQVLRLAQGEF